MKIEVITAINNEENNWRQGHTAGNNETWIFRNTHGRETIEEGILFKYLATRLKIKASKNTED